MTWPFHLSPPEGTRSWRDPHLTELTREAAGDVKQALALAPQLASAAEALGRDSARYLRTLVTLGGADLTVARAIEPHLDALAILHQAAVDSEAPDLHAIGVTSDSTWGVYAAQAPGLTLTARPDGGNNATADASDKAPGTHHLSGTKPWCSLAGAVSHALVTASEDGGQRLFAIDLADPGITRDDTTWVPRGLAHITTSTLTMDEVPAVAVGGPGWYLDRPGFAWGGIGVGAIWFGAACSLAMALTTAATKREPDQIALLHLGRLDLVLGAAAAALNDAAQVMDSGTATPEEAALLASRVRGLCAEAAETTMTIVGHALGPSPLAHDETHAARVADLTLYVRQHHAERDLARLGSQILAADS